MSRAICFRRALWLSIRLRRVYSLPYFEAGGKRFDGPIVVIEVGLERAEMFVGVAPGSGEVADQVDAGGYELKVVAVGHLSCDDSGSVGGEEHLIVPGHDWDVRQDKIAEVAGGEGESGSDGDQPAKLYSARRFNRRGVVKGGRC